MFLTHRKVWDEMVINARFSCGIIYLTQFKHRIINLWDVGDPVFLGHMGASLQCAILS